MSSVSDANGPCVRLGERGERKRIPRNNRRPTRAGPRCRLLSFAKTQPRDWTMSDLRASHREQCPSHSLSWAYCARSSQGASTSCSRIWRSGNKSPCSAAVRSDRIRTPRSSPLGVALQPLGWVARGAPSRSSRNRDSLAPAGLSRVLDLEVPPTANGSTSGRLGACGPGAHHGARESHLGRATHPRRVAETRARRLAAHRGPAHAASPKAAISDLVVCQNSIMTLDDGMTPSDAGRNVPCTRCLGSRACCVQNSRRSRA